NIAPATRLKLHHIPYVIHKLERVLKNTLIDRNQRRSECGWVAAGQRMIVVSRGKDQHVFVISILNGPQELLSAMGGLQTLLRNPQRQVDHFALPYVDGPVQSFDDRLHIQASQRTKPIGRDEADPP